MLQIRVSRRLNSRIYFYKWRQFSVLTSVWSSQPVEAPKIEPKWFYAKDIPLSKPAWYDYTKTKDASNFVEFSENDSKRLEKAFQALHDGGSPVVNVSEDKLFQVDLKSFELSPAYWQGPVYEVRRGIWFNSSGYPVPEKLSKVLEEGYQSKKPYLFEQENKKRTNRILEKFARNYSDKKFKKQIEEVQNDDDKLESIKQIILKSFNEDSQSIKDILEGQSDTMDLEDDKRVLFCDEKNAVVFPTSMNSKFHLEVLRNFGASKVGLLTVEKVQRGFSEDEEKSWVVSSNPIDGLNDVLRSEETDRKGDEKVEPSVKNEKAIIPEDSGNREIDHLVLCIHGIGQILGHQYESVNFTHSINVLRSTMNEVYKNNAKLHKLAYPNGGDTPQSKTNNRIQVLPISWRHNIDFHPGKRYESFDEEGEPRFPTLSEISVDGVKPLRKVLGDVVLDVLLYCEPRYIQQIFDTVTNELNRVYKLYIERNPNFKGKVHIMGHSLGSVISFDILSGQLSTPGKDLDLNRDLLFEVDCLFCVGSPVGVFKLLERTNIKSRSQLPDDYKPNKDYDFASPKCQNLYNIFHPCDPVGYRMEPLVAPRFANLKPVEIPFALEGINTQLQDLAGLGDDIQEKLAKAASWFSKSTGKEISSQAIEQSIEEKAFLENALGDILRSLALFDNGKDKKEKKKAKKVDLDSEDLKVLSGLNRSGRIDYSLPMGVFDISLVSAISAHVSYFEDEDTAGFIMKEILASQDKPVESVEADIYK